MDQFLGNVAILVHDYDEAITYYTQILGFQLVEDTILGPDKRWVRVAPLGRDSTCLLLAKAIGEVQQKAVGNQAGGRVFLFLHSDDFWRDYHRYRERGVMFLEEPRKEPYGVVAVFQDLYGNRWDLLQMRDDENKNGKE